MGLWCVGYGPGSLGEEGPQNKVTIDHNVAGPLRTKVQFDEHA